MIRLTRLDGSVVFVNIDAIILIEDTGGSVLKLGNGESMRVLEPSAEIAERAHVARADVMRRALGVTTTAEVLTLP